MPIEKENIFLLHFPKEDVLFSKDERLKRQEQLDKTTSLLNIDRVMAEVIFQDIEGLKKISTTIINITTTEVLIEHEVGIPVHRILKINRIN